MRQSKSQTRLFTFASGGWVLLVTALLTLAIFIWAVAPAVLRSMSRPPGDGKNIDSYGFDLSNLAVSRHLVAPAMLYRDMVPVMSNPSAHDAEETQRINDPKYGKYLVSSDRVIGVSINGECRAYPISVMYVHEIINDELGGVPIAVTYHWPCDSTVVFDRRIQGGGGSVAEFTVSGLVYNSNMLMFDRHETSSGGTTPPHGGGSESLWSQLLAKPISGRALTMNESLATIHYEIAKWGDWLQLHPQTTVIDRDLGMSERYKDAAPTQYFNSSELIFPVEPMPPANSPHPKTPILAVSVGDDRRVYPLPWLAQRATRSEREAVSDEGAAEFHDKLGPAGLRFVFSRDLQYVRVESDSTDHPAQATYAYWFAWHALHPADELAATE